MFCAKKVTKLPDYPVCSMATGCASVIHLNAVPYLDPTFFVLIDTDSWLRMMRSYKKYIKSSLITSRTFICRNYSSREKKKRKSEKKDNFELV
jgi:hypothetical protein